MKRLFDSIMCPGKEEDDNKEENQTTSTSVAIPTCGLIVSEGRPVAGILGEAPEASSRFYLAVGDPSRREPGGNGGSHILLHVPAGQRFHQSSLPDNAVNIYCVRYRTELLPPALDRQLVALGTISLDLTKGSVSQARIFRSIFQEMLFEQSACQENWEMMLSFRLMDVVIRALRLVRRRGRNNLPSFEAGGDSAERVARYALSLKTRYFRQETVGEAAAVVGLGARQFAEVFRKVTGKTWRSYILGLRLSQTAELLEETDRSVIDVAFECGFDDLSNFNHFFKAAYGCSPVAYRRQRQVLLPENAQVAPRKARAADTPSGFKLRGIKGWFWSPEQYLEEIPVLAELRMNFLMNCYGSMMASQPGQAWCNEWWKPMPEERMEAYGKIIRACRENRIEYCFTMHPQLASPQPLDPAVAADVDRFYQHFSWAQGRQVQWFSIFVDGTRWGAGGPALAGLAHAGLVNTVFGRLREGDKSAQFIFCPAICWGDAANQEHRDYLGALAKEMHPDVYVLWSGDGIVTPRVTRIAADGFRKAVNHRLILCDNYPVNNGSPTLHLGPVSGREPDLWEVIDGYLSNPMYPQNQINRLPLATCADYAFDPRNYNPARSIGRSILRLGKTTEQQHVLKDLVEAYPGFIVAGGGAGTNPVRGKFDKLIADQDSRSAARKFINHMEGIHTRLTKFFPKSFAATRKTIIEDIEWMKRQTG